MLAPLARRSSAVSALASIKNFIAEMSDASVTNEHTDDSESDSESDSDRTKRVTRRRLTSSAALLDEPAPAPAPAFAKLPTSIYTGVFADGTTGKWRYCLTRARLPRLNGNKFDTPELAWTALKIAGANNGYSPSVFGFKKACSSSPEPVVTKPTVTSGLSAIGFSVLTIVLNPVPATVPATVVNLKPAPVVASVVAPVVAPVVASKPVPIVATATALGKTSFVVQKTSGDASTDDIPSRVSRYQAMRLEFERYNNSFLGAENTLRHHAHALAIFKLETANVQRRKEDLAARVRHGTGNTTVSALQQIVNIQAFLSLTREYDARSAGEQQLKASVDASSEPLHGLKSVLFRVAEQLRKLMTTMDDIRAVKRKRDDDGLCGSMALTTVLINNILGRPTARGKAVSFNYGPI